MQFKTNHSPWPFEIHHEDGDWLILDSNGRIIAETWGADNEDMSEANRDLFCAAPSMLKYMIERAKYISTELSSDKFIFNRYNTLYRKLYEELKRVLAILKDAGVEVIE